MPGSLMPVAGTVTQHVQTPVEQSVIMPIRKLAVLTATTLAIAGLAGEVRAVTFTESGDAGATLSTASATGASAGTTLEAITGSLSSSTDADLFAINITVPGTFSASTVGGSLVDTQLFLFNSIGSAVYFNDDASGTSTQSFLPGSSTFSPTTAGLYYLAITPFGLDPVNSISQLLFNTGNPTDVLGPAPGVSGPLAGFTGGGSPGGAYTISLTSATTAVPEPSSVLGLLALAGGGAWLRLKRRDKVRV